MKNRPATPRKPDRPPRRAHPKNGNAMLHVGHLVQEELSRQRRSVVWLAERLYCDRTNIYRLFRKGDIDTGMLMRLSRILEHDFFADLSRHYEAENDL